MPVKRRPSSSLELPDDIVPLERAEWEYLTRVVLPRVNGNVSEAARRLGIDRRTLQRKLRRFGA